MAVSPSSATTVQRLVTQVSLALSPLQASLSSADAAVALLGSLGWAPPPGFDLARTLGVDATGLITKLERVIYASDDDKADELGMATRYLELLAAVTKLVIDIDQAAQRLPGALAAAGDYVAKTKIDQELLARLLDFLLMAYTNQAAKPIFSMLQLLGIFSLEHHAADPAQYQVEHWRAVVHYERLSVLVTDPKSLFQTVYGWNTATFDAHAFLRNLATLLESFWIKVKMSDVPVAVEERIAGHQIPNAAADPSPQMVIGTAFGVADATVEVGLATQRLRATAPGANDAGLIILPFAAGTLDEQVALTSWLTLELLASFSLEGGVGLLIRPTGVEFQSALLRSGSVGTVASGRLGVGLHRVSDPGKPMVLVSAEGGIALDAKEIYVRVIGGADQGPLDLVIEAGIVGGRLIAGTANADSFITKVIPPGAAEVDFDLGLRWSKLHGVQLAGNPNLVIEIPLHQQAGPITLTDVRIGLSPDSTALKITGTVSGSVALGPIEATVRNIGAFARVKFQRGNLGPVDVAIGFQPPDGVGLEVNAVAVTGGGFIAHDEQKKEYDGILVLEVEDVVSIKAITILTTGENNFSLAALIFVEDFTPIQLGLGFTLDGIGGMVAINRQADIAVLQAGIKTGLINDLLFPADPIHDAVRIISNLERAFPIAQGRYLFGPMVQIGWGEPEPLIYAELGLLIELPSPVRLIILGKIEALLPKPEAHIVELHMDVLGVVDFAASSLAIDATIHDSRVVSFALTGDMALRLIWAGPGRTFMLSVGGFNPRYQPPPGFPKLNRLALTLATSDNPKLRLDAYLALTSNTAQIGAHLELIATAGSFGVHGEAGFDALLQFEPFLFIVDFHAGIALLVSGSPFMSLSLDGTLTGPNPWHVHGDASYHVLFFSISVTVDFTIGQAVVEPPPPQPQIHASLVKALSSPGSWGAQVSQAGTFVTLRKVEAAGKLLAHPVGVLSAHEKVVPLEVEIERFGSVKLDQPHTFSIPSQSVKVNGVATAPSAVPDYFAMAQFKQLSDDEKLSRPSFESYPAGIRIDAEAPTLGTAHHRDVAYDEVTVDPGAHDTRQKAQMTIDQFTAHRVPGGITRSDRLGRRRFGGPTRPIAVRDTSYVVATTDTLTSRDIAGVGARATFTQAADALRRHTSTNPADRGRLQVVAGHEVAG